MALGSEGTVRGAFDLDTRPAIRGVREYRREAARADAQTRQLGSSMDDAFGKQGGSIAEMRGELTELRSEMKAVESELIPIMDRKTRKVHEQTRAVRSLRLEVARLGNTRGSARVDVDGIAAALAKVELLHSRIQALGNERASARVGVSGGFGSAASRAAAGAASGAAGGGGGGSGGGILSMGGIGFAGLRGGTLLAGAAGILPAAQGLLGGATGILSSGGAGALGAGAVGLGGMAPLVAGLGATVAIAKPANEALKEGIKLQDKYSEAIRKYGRASKEAAAARDELNRATAMHPGMGATMREFRGFRRDWRRQTQPGQRDYFGMLTDVTRIGRRASPVLAQNANTAVGAVRGSVTDFAGHLTNTESLGHMSAFTHGFARELPVAERSLEHSVTAMMRLSRAAMPFFHEANVWVENWTGGWNDSVKNVSETRSQISDLVDSGKEWADLLDSSWDLLKTISSASKPSGDSLVGSLTETFRRWDATLKANPTQTRRFFEDAANSTREMASAMSDFAGFLHEVADLLRPTFDRVMQLLQAFSSLGLAGPGVGAALLGAYRGGRVRGGAGAPGAAAGGGSTLMPMAMGTGGMGGTGRYGLGAARGTYSMQRQAFGASRGAAAMTAAGGLFGRGAMPLAGAALRGAGKAFWPVALGMGALDFANFQGNVGQRAQAALSGATLGLVPRPLTADESFDRGAGQVQPFLRNLPGDTKTLAGQRSQLGTINTAIQKLPGSDFYYGMGAHVEGSKEVSAFVTMLKEERDIRREIIRDSERERRAAQRERERQRGTIYGGQLPQAFREYRRAGMTPSAAAEATTKQVGKKIGSIGEGGVEALGESSLAWARTVAKNAPALKGVVDDIADDIEARYKKMGRRVNIVNGDILLGTKREWGQIRDALTSASEVARQKVTEDFTAIQQKAVGSLRSMGFDAGQARQLVSALEGGGAPGRVARSNIGVQQAGGRTMIDPIPQGSGRRNRRARGGVVAGSGLADTVPMGDGLVAPGEAWIANRHTMRDLSRATLAQTGFTAEQIISGEHRRHSAPTRFARGGRGRGLNLGNLFAGAGRTVAGAASSTGGYPGLKPGIGRLTNIVLGQFPGLSVTSTTGGTHAAGSYHYRGMAVDIGGPTSLMNQAAQWIGQAYGSSLAEGIHNPGLSWKGGQRVPPSFWGASTWAGHANHIHLAVASALGARGDASMPAGGGGGGMGHIRLRGVGRRQGGVPGALRQRAGDMHAAGLQRRINQTLDKMAPAGGSLEGFSGGGGAAANMRLGHRMMLRLWGDDQWPALRELWTRESGWRNVMNTGGSGATGIPQALPGSKMASAGADWRTNPATQIKWGLNYIHGRYGTPQQALAFHHGHNWYSRGGRMADAGAFERGGSFVTNGPTQFVAGEGSRRRERVTVHPVGATSTGGGGGVQIGELRVHVSIEGGIKSREDEDRIAERVGEKVVKKIISSIDKGTATGVIG